jgi:hypothetical protein
MKPRAIRWSSARKKGVARLRVDRRVVYVGEDTLLKDAVRAYGQAIRHFFRPAITLAMSDMLFDNPVLVRAS